MKHFTTFRRYSLVILTTLIAACADYEFKVNQKVMYTPSPLFSDFQVADQALLRCLEQHIQDQQVRSPDALRSLACTHAGIRSLAGLERFNGLETLQLDNNEISDVSPVARLTALQALYLRNNQVRDASSLTSLPLIVKLDLVDNKELECAGLDSLMHLGKGLRLPRHCQG